MYGHHIESAQRLKEYFAGKEGVIAVIWGGSTVKGNERPDSDIDAIVVVTDERYAALERERRTAEVITGYCTYEGGYFDVKYKTKGTLAEAAQHGSEPTRNAYVRARVLWTLDAEIPALVENIARYPEHEVPAKLECFCADLQLNRGYFLKVVSPDNAYMRAHLAQQIVYSVYRLILLDNRVLFPCNRRLEETVRACKKRPGNILELGRECLGNICEETCEAFVGAFWKQSALPLFDDVSRSCACYVKYYEDWWRAEHPPVPDEW